MPHPRRRARLRSAPRVGLRAHRGGGYAVGRGLRPGTPTTTTRPTSTSPTVERLGRERAGVVRDLELGHARARVPAQPPVLVDGRVPGPRLRSALPSGRSAVLEPAHAGPLRRGGDGGRVPSKRPTNGSMPTSVRSRPCSSPSAPAVACRPQPSTASDLEVLDDLLEPCPGRTPDRVALTVPGSTARQRSGGPAPPSRVPHFRQ